MQPIPVISCAAARELDRRAVEEFGIPSILLMENAARGVCDTLLKYDCRGPVAIVCGKGNNGGDGLALARRLDLLGIPVQVFLFAQPHELRGDAALNYRIAHKSQIPLVIYGLDFQADSWRLEKYEWLIDALLGTGSSGEPREPLRIAIECMNRTLAKKMAIDLPSGLNADTGTVAKTTFRADVTVTFVAHKPGFALSVAQPYLGKIEVVDIGAPRCLVATILQNKAENNTATCSLPQDKLS
jgi:NAD(P)H-hydrate epimerase